MKIEEAKSIYNTEIKNYDNWTTKVQIEQERICNLLDVDFF